MAGLCNFAHGDEELRRYRGEAEPPGGINGIAFENGMQKFYVLERNLEQFAKTQSALIENLKSLAMNFESTNGQYSEQTASSIEDTLLKIYKSSLNYSDIMLKIIDIKVPEKDQAESHKESSEEAKTRAQLSLLIAKLKALHSKNGAVLESLAKAEVSLNANLVSCANILQEILYDEKFDRSTQIAHKNLINEARSERFNSL